MGFWFSIVNFNNNSLLVMVINHLKRLIHYYFSYLVVFLPSRSFEGVFSFVNGAHILSTQMKSVDNVTFIYLYP